MNRKKFIQTSGVGVGIALLSGIASSKPLFGKTNLANKLSPKIIKDNEGEVFNVLGDVQKHKLVGSDTNNQIVEWVDDVEPGVGIPPHVHTKEDEIFRVIKGEVEIWVGGKSTVLQPGDTAFAPKNVPHSWTVVGTEKAKMITSAFPAGIEKMFHELAELPPGPPDLDRVGQICGNYGINFIK
ncbi:cupin domain-containing protein [Marivirga harenae]|uniref:cupin domain-containing protein n=1 Tax=Marivirga harenae TaxID=2010992 RepID=UPI0026E029EC|nr:cupin domain-containing protein [Marivirga harenae]WKV12256.1 cupin domain-containing protein [Marivirga harenae]